MFPKTFFQAFLFKKSFLPKNVESLTQSLNTESMIEFPKPDLCQQKNNTPGNEKHPENQQETIQG